MPRLIVTWPTVCVHFARLERLPAGSPLGEARTMTVLVVDDTDTARDVVERILRFHGVNAFGARNGFEALVLLDQVNPDLVLLDVSMPEMDGLTVLERIRENPRWHDTPVVMMTAISDAESVGKAFRLGACEYLVKADFSAPKMLEVVRRHAQRN